MEESVKLLENVSQKTSGEQRKAKTNNGIDKSLPNKADLQMSRLEYIHLNNSLHQNSRPGRPVAVIDMPEIRIDSCCR